MRSKTRRRYTNDPTPTPCAAIVAGLEITVKSNVGDAEFGEDKLRVTPGMCHALGLLFEKVTEAETDAALEDR